MISYDKLGKDYLVGRATMPVAEANHRESLSAVASGTSAAGVLRSTHTGQAVLSAGWYINPAGRAAAAAIAKEDACG
jgi:hypothetical protein